MSEMSAAAMTSPTGIGSGYSDASISSTSRTQLADHRAGLQHGPDPAAADGVDRWQSEDGDRAAVGTAEAEDEVEGRGLAGAVGPEQGDGLTRLDDEVDAAHGGYGPVGPSDAAQLDAGIVVRRGEVVAAHTGSVRSPQVSG